MRRDGDRAGRSFLRIQIDEHVEKGRPQRNGIHAFQRKGDDLGLHQAQRIERRKWQSILSPNDGVNVAVESPSLHRDIDIRAEAVARGIKDRTAGRRMEIAETVWNWIGEQIAAKPR
jgi:hypothetical protein